MISPYSYYANYSTEYKAVLYKAIELGFLLPSTNQQKLQDNLMRSIISSGVFAKTDLIYVTLNDAGIDFGRINWKDPNTFMLSVNGPMKFIKNYGPYAATELATDKAWFGTGWIPATDAVNFTMNGNSMVTRAVSGYGSSGFFVTTTTVLTPSRLLTYHFDQARVMVNNSTASGVSVGITSQVTLMNRRTASNAMGLHYVSGGVVQNDITSAAASVARPLDELHLMGHAVADTDYPFAALGVNHPYEFCCVGSNLTNPEFIALDSALITYANAFRYAVALYALGAQSYTVPAGITQLLVECFGGGGSGRGYTTTASNTGGGGAGGGYGASLINVTPGQIITYYIGNGGAASGGAGPQGIDTYWNGGEIVGRGGQGAGTTPSVAALGGGAWGSANVGQVIYNGGSGGLGGPVLNASTGAGGSGAGALGAGLAGLNGATGSAITKRTLYNCLGPTNPGFSQSNALNGPGISASLVSGGSGARRSSTGTRLSGAGGQGYIRVSAPRIY